VKPLRIIALLAVAAGIALAAVYRHAIDPAAIRNAIAANPLAPILFVGLQVAASLMFVPRTVLGVAAGLLFGFFWGTVWALCGARPPDLRWCAGWAPPACWMNRLESDKW
jgi:uncharacterized membrane protein YdjX (TVP38/TMEM64 family)